MRQSIKKIYTIQDLMNLTSDDRAELIGGEIYMMAPATAKHSNVSANLILSIKSYCDARRQIDDNDSWVIIPEAWTFYDEHNSFVHDIAGYSSRELKTLPSKGPILTRPIWVCEILSPSNWSNDTQHKRVVLEEYRVPYYWLVDPERTSILVFEMNQHADHYQIVRSVSKEDGVVHIPPFEDVDLDLNKVFELFA